MKAFSEEWIKNFEEKINSSAEYQVKAKNWEWPLVLSMIDNQNEKCVFMDLKNGTCSTARVATESDLETAEFVISASKESWEKILNRLLDPMMAVLTKKLELKKGNVGLLVKNVDAAKELIEIASQLDSEF